MAVLYEIFVQKIYDITCLHDNLIVLDIGMNVGVASHYFASKPNVKMVYGFEPFPETFAEAAYNASLNEHLGLNIISYNKGVSDTTCTKTIPLFDSGSLSASTTTQENTFGKVAGKFINVDLVAANMVLADITNNHPDSHFMLKIDCEGEEYAIFDSFYNTNLFDKVDCILVEWHEKGPDPIMECLQAKGFQYLHIPNETLNCGMIYAFKLHQ
jgi:FkbM family methyltransferase